MEVVDNGRAEMSVGAQLSLIILTYNEEKNLPACLASLKGLECEIFVVGIRASEFEAGKRLFERIKQNEKKQRCVGGELQKIGPS